jgi:hypothetical protein
VAPTSAVTGRRDVVPAVTGWAGPISKRNQSPMSRCAAARSCASCALARLRTVEIDIDRGPDAEIPGQQRGRPLTIHWSSARYRRSSSRS